MNDKSTQVLSIGRNDLCWCGSGKKYEKCCLDTIDDRERRHTVDYQKDMASKMSHFNSHTICKSSEELGLGSLSEMILEFADDMLRHSDTYQEQKMAVEIAIIAWNIALLDKDDQQKIIDDFLSTAVNKKDRKYFKPMIELLIEKRLKFYADEYRIVIHHEILETEDGLHLNVASAVHTKEAVS